MHLQGLNIAGYISQAEFSKEHLDSFFTENDVQKIKDWGFNVIRLPVDYFFFEDDNNPYIYMEDRLNLIDKIFYWTEKYDIYLLLDLHKAPGHSFDPNEKGKNDIWGKNCVHRDRFIKIWHMLSNRYRKFDKIMYDIMNEPVAPNNSWWLDLAEEGIKAIRANDPNHYIIVESNMWGKASTFKNMRKFNDDKIIYSFHHYEPLLVTHQLAEWHIFYDLHHKCQKYPGKIEKINGLKGKVAQRDKDTTIFFNHLEGEWNKNALEKTLVQVLKFREKFHVPILCGEFGCITKADPETRFNWTQDMVALFQKHGISYIYWSYKNMEFGLYDFTESKANNPNYRTDERLDTLILSTLQQND
jgi:endoglucanase